MLYETICQTKVWSILKIQQMGELIWHAIMPRLRIKTLKAKNS